MALIARHSPRPLRVADSDAPRCARPWPTEWTFGTDPVADSTRPRSRRLSHAGMPRCLARWTTRCTRTSPSSDSSHTASGASR